MSRIIHGILDYLTGAFLVASPWLFGFANDKASSLLALGFGGFLIVYTLITDFEVAVIRLIPFPGHIFLDYLSIVGLVGAPILFAFHGAPAYVFVIVGLFDLVVTACTRKRETPDLPVMPGAGQK
ncbi:MAG: hypothetical protein JWL59_1666 [Chthoniobacteraceae bacterium]|nr:hypothetical protein [Chthoniobacteraceae bacterium]